MDSEVPLGGMVMVLEGKVAPDLRRMAKKRSLTILEAPAADQAFQHVRSGCPNLIVVQAGRAVDEVLKFIRLATAASRHVPLVVTATNHTVQREREILRAGASYYVPGVAPGLLDPVLDAIHEANEGR